MAKRWLLTGLVGLSSARARPSTPLSFILNHRGGGGGAIPLPLPGAASRSSNSRKAWSRGLAWPCASFGPNSVHSLGSSGSRSSHSSTQVVIPEERLTISFSRSSGAGGQNVNKVNTKVEIRFLLAEADWIPGEVRARMAEQQASRLSKSGELVFVSQEHRTQKRNREEALRKLQQALDEACVVPKERNMRTGISQMTKDQRKADKRARSGVKRLRGNVRSSDW